MKKTLVALAVLAASGASFAQVTITGEYAYGYQSTTSGTKSEASGLGIDTSLITFSSTEDLGGGMTARAELGLDGANRSTIAGGDSKVSLTSTSFGRVELGLVKGPDYLSTIASAGAPVVDMDGKLTGARTSKDYLSYAAPVGPVTLILKHAESSATTAVGLGVGATGLSGKQRENSIAAVYSAGPLLAHGTFVSYDNALAGPALANIFAGTKDRAMAMSASYNLGFAKIGAGLVHADATNGAKVDDAKIGVSVPYNAWTFGATFGQSVIADAPATAAWNLSQYNLTATGVSYGAKYAFSKRTSVTAKYASWTYSGYSQYEGDGATTNGVATKYGSSGRSAGNTANEFDVILSHTF